MDMQEKERKGGFEMDKFGQRYEGICCGCFEPIFAGEGFIFRKNGRRFHRSCANYDSYYVRLEKRAAAREGKKEA